MRAPSWPRSTSMSRVRTISPKRIAYIARATSIRLCGSAQSRTCARAAAEVSGEKRRGSVEAGGALPDRSKAAAVPR